MDETLRGIGRIASRRADRVAIKETLAYLRGRGRAEIVRLLREGIVEGGGDAERVPVYETETGALAAELAGATVTGDAGGDEAPRVVVLFCHAERDDVFTLLARLGAVPLDPLQATAGRS